MPTVSIIIPTYNRADLLPQAIHSVLGQTHEDVELIIVDDGSSDGTRQIIDRIQDPRIHYLHQSNQGKTIALNNGIAASKGELICRLDSDDWFLPNCIADLVSQLEKNPEWGVAAGGYFLVNEMVNEIVEVSPWKDSERLDIERWLACSAFLWQGALIRREWNDRIGGYDPKIIWGDDWDYGLRLARAGCKMGWLKKPVLFYRQHPGAMSQHTEKLRHDTLYIFDKFFSDQALPEEIKNLKGNTYTQAYLNIAAREYADGYFEDARQDLATAIEMDPGILANGGKRLFFTLAWWARLPLYTLSPEKFIQSVLDHLPDTASQFQHAGRKAMGEFWSVQFFEAHRANDLLSMKQTLWKLLKCDPIRALGRGFISISFDTFLGTDQSI